MNYVAFKLWMLDNGYTFEEDCDLTVERIDVNGPYSPENCRLIPIAEQTRNRRNTVWVTHPDTGEKITATEYAELCGKTSPYICCLFHNGKPLPPILKDTPTLHVAAYHGKSLVRSFRTPQEAIVWWSYERMKIRSCLSGGARLAGGFGWYFTDDDGNRYKQTKDGYRKVE